MTTTMLPIDQKSPAAGANTLNVLVAVASAGTKYTDPFDGSLATSLQIFNTGTVTGVWIIQVSSKVSPVLNTDTDWTTLTLGGSITQPAGAASNDYIDLSSLGSRWARGKYTHTSGAGNVEAWAHTKG
jgi:hypothetical protein